MIDYSDKFKLKGKKAVIFGGCGLLGQKITEALVLSGAKTFVFDINKKIGKKLEKKYRKGLKCRFQGWLPRYIYKFYLSYY